MVKKTLLLNNNYECIAFVPEKRALRLVLKNKAGVLSEWEDVIRWSTGKMFLPATIVMKYSVPRFFKRRRCNRSGILKRDQFICQYCGIKGTLSNLTIDHIKRRCLGGKTTWENCVASCFECNNKKSNLTLNQSGMKLLKKPKTPFITIKYEYYALHEKHKDWEFYVH